MKNKTEAAAGILIVGRILLILGGVLLGSLLALCTGCGVPMSIGVQGNYGTYGYSSQSGAFAKINLPSNK